MKRVADLVTGEPPKASIYGRLYADPRTIALVRRVARLEGWSVTRCLDELLRAYVELRHPEWSIVETEVDPGAAKDFVGELRTALGIGTPAVERRAGERRTSPRPVPKPAERRKRPRRATDKPAKPGVA